MQVTTRLFSWLLVLSLLLAAPFALSAPTTPTEDFTDNLDGTVTHRITGLTWMRCAMGMTWDGTTCTGTASTYTWDQATKLTANFAGKSDWRLPSVAELNTIVERDHSSQYSNLSFFVFPYPLSTVFNTRFQSSTLAVGLPDYAWIVNFNGGGNEFSAKNSSNYVRLMRSDQTFDSGAPDTPTVDFIDNNDGTVTHLKTGLMWKRCIEGQNWTGSNCAGNAVGYDWNTAAALTSSSGGNSDWRLPSINELLTIVEHHAPAPPATNVAIFPNSTNNAIVWAGAGTVFGSRYAWTVSQGKPEIFLSTAVGFVRLVRSGQFFSPLGFSAQVGTPVNTNATSNALKVSPASAASAISIVGGLYAINGGSYTAAVGLAKPNDSVTVRLNSAPSFATTSRATLTIGAISGNFSVTTAMAQDTQVPSAPRVVYAAMSGIDNNIALSWSGATDNVGVTAYQVYRNGLLLTRLGNVTGFVDKGLLPAVTYTYRVAACDAANNCSGPSVATVAQTPFPQTHLASTPNLDFTDNLDGTVLHRKTGLTWMRCAIGMTWTGATCTGTASTYTWDEATKLTANFAGKSDWRLPSVAELTTIVEWDASQPAINRAIFPNVSDGSFWSGSPFASFRGSAWIVDFYKGDITGNDLRRGNYARLMRGTRPFNPLDPYTPNADFFDNGDGTVTHLKTGLMWITTAASTFDPKSAASTFSSAGHNDWRLPTISELFTIVEFQAYNPAINVTIFPVGSNISGYWSGSTDAADPRYSWGIASYGQSYNNTRAVALLFRLVRPGQFFSPWGFTAQTGTAPNSTVISNPLKLAPASAAANISIQGGHYSINNGPFTSATGAINPNDTVTVRVTSAPTPGTTTRATLTIGTISGDFTVTTAPDAQPPGVPGILSATPTTSPTGATGFKLTWSAANDNTGVTHYRINRNGILLAVVNNPISAYTDTQLTNNTQFTYTVQACDAAYNCSTVSTPASATRAGPLSIAPQLSAGAGHGAGIKNDGGLFTWGFNEAGQLGTGDSGQPITSPQRPGSTLSSAYSAVANGASHTLAVKLDGTLWTWGGNASGQLGDGTTTSLNTPIQIGTGYLVVAAGNSHSLGIKTDGTLWSWGNNGTGQLGDGTSNSTSIPTYIGTGFYTVTAGTSHTVAIKTDGTLWAWGSNNFGQLGDSTGDDRYAPQMIGSGFTAAAAGAFHTIAVKNDGTLWAWGQNTNGQLGDNTTQNRYAPVQVGSGYSPVSANGVTGTLAAGNAHSLALKPDGSLWAWGSNTSGQLGEETTTDTLTPKAIEPTNVFTTVAANANHSLALKPDGTVWSWGANSTGQLGDATLASRQSSVLVLNETVDGALDLIPEVSNTIPADKLPSFLVQVAKSADVTSTVKYNTNDLNQSGSVYIVAYLRPDSPLLLPSVNPTSKSAGGLLTKTTGCPANTTGTVPAVLTRSGWKQADCTTPTVPIYTGTLDTANNTFSMYDAALFDQTKDDGLFCVAYAGASTTSAKGLIRSVVSGVDANLSICPPIQIGATPDTAAPSIPLNIAAMAAGPGQVNLTWNAATDNTAVVRYNIYRGTTLIATLDNVTNYTDSSPHASTAYSYSVMACDAAANCSGQSTPAQTATPAQPIVTLGAGWNLVGNGGTTVMNVPSLFGDATKVISIWKWVKTGNTSNITYPNWAFYTPGQNDSGAAYAASKGYDTFTSIASGEGFWVNAKVAMSVPMTAPAWILSSVFAPGQSKALTPGWSLIATGEAQTASAFNKAMSTTPPAAGVIPINLTSLWAWQNSAQRWYFYAPSLDATGGLNVYLDDMSYLDFANISFAPTMGFWVNR